MIQKEQIESQKVFLYIPFEIKKKPLFNFHSKVKIIFMIIFSTKPNVYFFLILITNLDKLINAFQSLKGSLKALS